jgi:hypothetical protein
VRHLTKATPAIIPTFLLSLGFASHLLGQTAVIAVSPAQLAFSVPVGGVTGNQTILVTSKSSTAVTFTVAAFSGSNWLAVSPTSGTTPAMLMVAVSPGALTAGDYSGFLSIVAGGETTTVPATLNVNPTSAATITAAPVSLSFSFETGDTNPQSQTVSLSGSSGAALRPLRPRATEAVG